MTSHLPEPGRRRRIALLPLARRVALLTGAADGWSSEAAPEAGLRRLVLSDGPVGIRGGGFGSDGCSLLFPNPTALAAAWDESLVLRAGTLMGAQARAAGVDWLLAPVLNLHRSPFGGRHFECYSEDPLLTGRIAASFVRGVQSTGVAATAKHFAGNESETERLSYDARIDEWTLRELYLQPFEAVVRAGVASVMAAYNALDGVRATENHRLLTEILKEEWGFDGVVVSDWGAARSTDETALAGLDLVMPGPDGPWGGALVDAVRAGRVPEELVDDKLLRLLRLADRTAATPAPPLPASAEVRATLRELAVRGMVLLRNDGLLPLGPDSIGHLALVGPNAVRLTAQGGGSAQVRPERVVEPLDGLRRVLGAAARITVEPGVLTHRNLPRLDPAVAPGGLRLDFLDADGAVLRSEHRDRAHLILEQEPPEGTAALALSAELLLSSPGRHELAVHGGGAFRLQLGAGEPLEFTLRAPDRDPLSPLVEPAEFRTHAEGGPEPLALRLEYAYDEAADWHLFGLGHLPPQPCPDELLDRAVAAARAADTVVLVVGTTEEYESEGFDRDSLALPGRQDELVRRVCAANPRTVVVVNAGAPVLMPWAELPAALLWAWLPGQEGGDALADVLTGAAEPGGRLPTTFPTGAEALPSVHPEDGVLAYAEAHRFGYRSAVPALFPFGHGLGYTHWNYPSMEVRGTEDGGLVVDVRVHNGGTRTGREVVQVYLEEPGEPLRLIGFAADELRPGLTTAVRVTVGPRELRRWTPGGWTVPTGPHRLLAGRSSADLRLTAELRPGASDPVHRCGPSRSPSAAAPPTPMPIPTPSHP
ncbi:glycoside hydrolase family 3 C-terminal domain-containing protein [Streptomyces atratus]|uniref:glycoside hydrolase family 3 C-terminal domain-containing protein n=1 Tax=Streptomyces atratus TaxID=1893 RepID=UPI00366A347C